MPPLTIAVPDDVVRTAARLGVAEQLSQVIALSHELFGSTIALGVIEDPELVDWTHIAVYTRLRTTAEEAAAKQLRWCDSLRERIGNAATSFTLLVDLE